MSAPEYPRDIVTDFGGWHRIHKGHSLDRDAVIADWENCHGLDGEEADIQIQEWWLDYRPRVKWCGKYDLPCDLEGDWHAHWFGVSADHAKPEHAFTIVGCGS